MAKTKIALLYERLSRDDELQGESFSIQNQKIMLEDFARRNGYPRFKHFTDDGVSGTRFDRPGFMAMMEEVEDGSVEAIIVKDMSRLDRDYLKVGQVMEILRQRGVRLIAINDNVDTEKGDNDMTSFLNIMYEFYACDTSRKIKSVFKTKGMSGKHLTGTVILQMVYRWGASTVAEILKKREYLGHTINFKTRKHFKDKKSHYVDENEWTIFENTHDAIIDQETFDNVRRIRGNFRRYPDSYSETAPLTDLLYCADCGGKMYVHRTNNGKRISQYTCGQYSKTPVGVLCPT